MNRIYKYELLRGSKHYRCPNCNHMTFKPLVYTSDGKTIVGEEFGRCERINSCGYFNYPKFKKSEMEQTNFNNDFRPEVFQSEFFEPDFVDKEIVESTFCNFKENIFTRYIIKNFGSETFFNLQAKYNIGTAKNGGTIFWQEDIEGRFRTGKVFYYKPDGHRDKERASWFIHKKVKENFNLKQCLFGEHLLKDINVQTKVALCESEKTAVLMSVLEPDFIWLASGGSEMLNAERLKVLTNENILLTVYADNGQFEKWKEKTRFLTNRQMDYSVENAYKEGIIDKGADVLDLYLLKTDLSIFKKKK